MHLSARVTRSRRGQEGLRGGVENVEESAPFEREKGRCKQNRRGRKGGGREDRETRDAGI